MATRGGQRPNAGRKPKAEEWELIEKLSPLDDLAFSKLSDAIEAGEGWAMKLFFEYRFGKPKQSVDVTSNGEQIMNNQIITTLSPEQLAEYLKK